MTIAERASEDASLLKADYVALENDGDEPGATFSLHEAIDDLGFGRFQVLLLFLCGAQMAADSMEMMLLSFLAPAVKEEWSLETWQSSLLGSVVFIGILIGASAWGIVADRFGRRVASLGLTMCSVVFGVASALSPNVWVLMLMRLLTGFAVGGAHVGFSLFAEFLPTKTRGVTLMLVNVFWTIGIVFEAGLAWILLEAYPLGWRYFVAATAMPLALVLLFFMWLPESPRWLLVSGRTEDAMAVMRRLAAMNRRNLPPGVVRVPENADERGRFVDLFSASFRRITIPLWVIWFSTIFIYYGVVILTPEYFEQFAGSDSYMSTFITSLAELPSVFIGAFMLHRFGRKKTMITFFGVCALAEFPLAATVLPANLLVLFAVVSRLAIAAAFNTLYLYTPELYPTFLRSTGFGAASSVSRVAGIITPFVANVLIQVSIVLPVACYGVACVVASIAAVLMPLETQSMALQDSLILPKLLPQSSSEQNR
eukprot:TRINITY_DN1506_c0_g1_i1.p1 TRINITY_DN1506_c0_g1~~TRINITY_DN1506_c0_g1_i1.p1  ORF type:complete len:483 (+),score=120.83 TRINITY_DN1506_c0_g1_i1:138-1586(+)